MYKVVKIHNYAATRDIEIQNLDTGTNDLCFDDSTLVDTGYESFEFVEEGKIYDCKIELFGDFELEKTNTSVLIIIAESDVNIGNSKYFKVLMDADVYYILMSDANDFEVREKMYYRFTRKDLIQVDGIVHGDCF